ncbi:LysR family transcriptional regulator [Paraburkholderia acidipaludis]|uniref:LysR family transcriptional regulator n=1 Tax=Paraburkholderia acidipaludis TaxID=660537 RepID=UPI0009FE24E2|nr:LysR family transcriptional regulator [Paraburkholderia acidipaludis]
MDQLRAMRVFTRVVDVGSFTLASQQLGMSCAAVTRSVGMLEARLNMRLLNRSTRKLSLTDAGRLYLDGCRVVIEKLEEVESDLVRATRDPGGLLRIAAPSLFANGGLTPLLGAYREENPRVSFDVTVYDTQIDLIEGGFDVCFATDRQQVNATLVCRKLTPVKEIVVAAPAYLGRRGVPRAPADLAAHELLSVANSPRTWEFSDARHSQRISVHGPLTASSHATVHAAALAGLGIALLPQPLVADDIARGSLQAVLGRYDVDGGMRNISIVYPGRRYLTMKVRSFIDFAIEQFRGDSRDGLAMPPSRSRVAQGSQEPVTALTLPRG